MSTVVVVADAILRVGASTNRILPVLCLFRLRCAAATVACADQRIGRPPNFGVATIFLLLWRHRFHTHSTYIPLSLSLVPRCCCCHTEQKTLILGHNCCTRQRMSTLGLHDRVNLSFRSEPTVDRRRWMKGWTMPERQPKSPSRPPPKQPQRQRGMFAASLVSSTSMLSAIVRNSKRRLCKTVFGKDKRNDPVGHNGHQDERNNRDTFQRGNSDDQEQCVQFDHGSPEAIGQDGAVMNEGTAREGRHLDDTRNGSDQNEPPRRNRNRDVSFYEPVQRHRWTQQQLSDDLWESSRTFPSTYASFIRFDDDSISSVSGDEDEGYDIANGEEEKDGEEYCGVAADLDSDENDGDHCIYDMAAAETTEVSMYATSMYDTSDYDQWQEVGFASKAVMAAAQTIPELTNTEELEQEFVLP